MKDIFFKLMFHILKNYMNFIIIYHFYLRGQKLKKVKKLLANLHDKTPYVTHIRNLKQALNHRLVLEKISRVIKFNQNPRLKPYIGMNTDLRKQVKNDYVDE